MSVDLDRLLAGFAGLTDDERHAIDQWCYDQQREQDRRIDEEVAAWHTLHAERDAAIEDARCWRDIADRLGDALDQWGGWRTAGGVPDRLFAALDEWRAAKEDG